MKKSGVWERNPGQKMVITRNKFKQTREEAQGLSPGILPH